MIHFYESIVTKALKTIKDAYDCADILHDLSRIEQAKANVSLYGGVSTAHQLDEELRKNIPVLMQ